VLPRCQYAVPCDGPQQVFECGEPAVAVWTWTDNEFEALFVCEEHDRKIEEDEEGDAQ